MTDTFFIVGIVLMIIGYFLFFQSQSMQTAERRKKLERMSRNCSLTAGLAFQAITLSLLVMCGCFFAEQDIAPGAVLLVGALGAQYVAVCYYLQKNAFVRYKYKKTSAAPARIPDTEADNAAAEETEEEQEQTGNCV